MASNETVAEIVSDMRVYAKKSKVNGGEVDVWNWLAHFADRIEAAHKREIAAKDDARLTIVAIYENVIAGKDAEIAELQRRLKVAEEFATEMKQSTNSLVRACGHQMILRLQGEGGNDGK